MLMYVVLMQVASYLKRDGWKVNGLACTDVQ